MRWRNNTIFNQIFQINNYDKQQQRFYQQYLYLAHTLNTYRAIDPIPTFWAKGIDDNRSEWDLFL